MKTSELVENFSQGDLRTLSRLISAAENREPSAASVLAEVFSKTGRARVVGITGPPGAGKSTLTSFLVKRLRSQKRKVAVVAVDPVSPFTGGALLGDRIRLVDHFNDAGVFIRSLSTRGILGGLSLATREVVHLLDAYGFDDILIETVGVGQSEVDVREIADLTLLVLVPEWGDGVQMLKAGVLEIADLFAVNKADREGADRLATELRGVLQMAARDEVPVLTTSSSDEASLSNLYQQLYSAFQTQVESIRRRREASRAAVTERLVEGYVLAEAKEWVKGRDEATTANPYRVFLDFLASYPSGSLFGKRGKH